MALALAFYILASLLLLFADRVPHRNRIAWSSAIVGSSCGALCLALAYSFVLSGAINGFNPNTSGKTITLFVTFLSGFIALPFMTIALWHALATSENNGVPREAKSLHA